MTFRATYLLLIILLSLPTAGIAQMPGPYDRGPYGLDDRTPVTGPVTVSGSVSDIQDRPLADVRIELRDASSGQVASIAYTLPNGSFELNQVSPGSYVVTALRGTNQVQERVTVRMGSQLHLRMPIETAKLSPDEAVVSVAQLKVPDKARRELEKAQKAFHKGKTEEARKHTAKALEIFPDYGQALTLQGILSIDEGNKEEARELLEKAVSSDSSYGLGFIALGSVYNLFNRFDDALRVLDRGIRLAPHMWQGFFESAKALVGKGDYSSALRETDRASSMVSQTFSPMHLVRADAFIGLKNYDAAINELKKYLEQEPNGEDAPKIRRALEQLKGMSSVDSAQQ